MMSDHELKSLRHTRILEFHKFYSEYHLWLQSSSERFRIRIRIYETNDGRFFFVQSHYVHTPLYDGDASSTQLAHDTSHLALSHAIDSITSFYENGISAGHEPSDDWFVPNSHF